MSALDNKRRRIHMPNGKLYPVMPESTRVPDIAPTERASIPNGGSQVSPMPAAGAADRQLGNVGNMSYDARHESPNGGSQVSPMPAAGAADRQLGNVGNMSYDARHESPNGGSQVSPMPVAGAADRQLGNVGNMSYDARHESPNGGSQAATIAEQNKPDAAMKPVEEYNFDNLKAQKEQEPAPAGNSAPAPASGGIIDTSNAIGSLADLLGPTPAEREAQQAKMERGRNQMAMWAGLFDGLRHLGNLYYTAKGAKPQQFNDAYKQIDENYQRKMKNLDDMAAYRQAYAKQLYALQHQQAEDKRKEILDQSMADYRKAQADWYKDRGELDKLKAIRVIKQKDGRLQKYDPVTNTIEDLTEADPLYQDYVRSQINRNNRTGNGTRRNGSVGEYEVYETQGVDEQGNKWKRKTRTNGNSSSSTVTPAGKTQPKSSKEEEQKKTTKDNNSKPKSKTQL